MGKRKTCKTTSFDYSGGTRGEVRCHRGGEKRLNCSEKNFMLEKQCNTSERTFYNQSGEKKTKEVEEFYRLGRGHDAGTLRPSPPSPLSSFISPTIPSFHTSPPHQIINHLISVN